MTERSFVDSNSSNARHYFKNSENETKIFGEEIIINNNNESKSNNNSDIESLEYIIPDGGYGWAIVFATFAVNSITLGYGYTWGIYQDYYYKYVFHEQTSTSVLLFVGSISTSSIFLLGPISTYMINRFGHRPLMVIGTTFYATACLLASFSVTVWQLFLTQGLLWGISSSIVFYTVISLPSLWFDKRRGLANGIAISGSGIGPLIYSPIISKLLTELGHRWTIRIFGLFGTILLLISTALVRFPPNYELKDNNNDNPDNEKILPSKKEKIFDFGIFKIPEFVGVAFASFFIPFGFLVPFYLLPSYAAHIGISEGVAASVVGIASGANALGRVLLGYTSDAFGRTNTFFLCSFISGIVILLIWTFSTSLASLTVFAITYGLNAGGFISLFPVVLVDIVGYDRITNAVGFAYSVAAFGTAFGSPIAGALLDLSKSISSHQGSDMYFLPKMYSGSIIIFGSLFLLWVKLRINKNLFAKV